MTRLNWTLAHSVKVRELQSTDHEEWLAMRAALWPHCTSERHAMEMHDYFSQGGSVATFVAAHGDGQSLRRHSARTPRAARHALLATSREFLSNLRFDAVVSVDCSLLLSSSGLFRAAAPSSHRTVTSTTRLASSFIAGLASTSPSDWFTFVAQFHVRKGTGPNLFPDHMKIARLLFIVANTSAIAGLGAEADYLQTWRAKMSPISPRHYVCQYTDVVPRIDGRLDDVAWVGAQWTEDFVDIEGASKPKPTFRTRAMMLWDNDYLYIAGEMEEPHVWGTLTKHDSVIFHDPDFEVFIDPDGDSHDYVEFEINALNTSWDLFLPKPYKDGGKADNSFELSGIKTAVHIRGTLNNLADRDEGWSVEIALPWQALASKANRRTPPRNGDQWRIGFSRVEWQINTNNGKYTKVPNTAESNWVWSPQGVIDMHRPERWGYVQFSRAKGAAFVPDGAEPARDALQGVYYAQRSFQNQHGRWATKLDELALEKAAISLNVQILRSTPDGWEAMIKLPLAAGPSQQWVIRQDARIWRATKP